jgi:hypothetical protein
LDIILSREQRQIPMVIQKCTEAIEMYGTSTPELYRTSGPSAQVQKLKALFDIDPRRVNLHDPEWRANIHSITGVVKLFFRELPDPLITRALYPDFIRASRTIY